MVAPTKGAKDPKSWDYTRRERIKSGEIINRLQAFVFDKNDSNGKPVVLSSVQVNAALGLLKKSLPDLKSAEVHVTDNRDSHEDWLAKEVARNAVETAVESGILNTKG
jgi:hypothetical protein